MQAVSLELGELFPFSRPDYFCRVFRSSSAYMELDIWAWESESYDALRKILPFHYAVPEDAAFSSAAPELMVWTYGGITHLLAAENGRFLGAASQPADAVTEGDVGRFLKSLDPYGVEIQKIRIYGELPFSLKQTPDLTVANETDRGYPPCIAALPSVSSREFRARGEVQLPSYQGLLLRIVIYCILGYGLFLYLTVRNFDQSTQELRKISRQMDRQILMTDSGKGNSPEDFSEVLKELKRMGKTILVSSHILHELAQICTRIGIVEAGRLVAEGALEQIYRELGLKRIVHVQISNVSDDLVARVGALQGVASVERQLDRLCIRIHQETLGVEDLLDALRGLGARIFMFQPEVMDMETVFMKLTEGKAT